MGGECEAIICRDLKHLKWVSSSFRQRRRIVLTTGVYDILHEGHLKYLNAARSMGDVLIVGINSDAFARKLKGEGKPIFPEAKRAFMVAGFRCVDAVCVFDDRLAIVDAVKPDVFVMSTTSHAKPETRMEQQDRVRRYGGEIVILGEMTHFHSSSIAKAIGAI